jgi:hypothetical protein
MDDKLDTGNFCEKNNFFLLDVYIKNILMWITQVICDTYLTLMQVKLKQAPLFVHGAQLLKGNK